MLTTAELNFIASSATNYIYDNGLLLQTEGVLDPVMQFIQNITVTPDFVPASDEERLSRDTIDYSKGTIDLIGDNGIPQGVDYNEERLTFSQVSRRKQYGGYFSIIERNVGKLEKVIKATGFKATAYDEAGLLELKVKAAETYKNTTYGQQIINEIAEDLNAKIKNQLYDALDAGETTMFMGVDPIIAESATILDFSNLVNAAFSDSSLETGIALSRKHKTRRGNPLPSQAFRYCFAEVDFMNTVIKITKPKYSIHQNYNNLLGDDQSSKLLVLPYFTSKSGRVIFLNETHALKIEADTPFGMPRIVIGQDPYGNRAFVYSWIFTTKWIGRHGILAYPGTEA